MGGLIQAAEGAAAASIVDELNLRILKLENRFQRERIARLQAEAIAEKGLSDLYERQQQIALLEQIATVANQSRSITETLGFAIEAICRHTGWCFGNAYLLSTDGSVLQPTDIWHAADPERVAPFIGLTRRTPLSLGMGLPGRVMEAGAAIWIPDVVEDANFPRALTAKACGLHAAFGLPILVGSDVLGVLEF
ncbi:MAG: Diguanylate cyclase protein, partial [Caulobacteraceae bacterium]|nr:Diguanylate cyclase protein [Caulobacteraceae bacterium]